MSGHEGNDAAPLSPGDQADASSPMAETPQGNTKPRAFELTPVEGVLFFNIIRFNKDTSAIDWDQVAIHSNLKNAASAKVRFRQIQKKYDLESLAKGTPKDSSTKKAATRKRKAATAAAGEDGEDGENGENIGVAEATPSKKLPARKRNGAVGAKGKGKAKGKNKNADTDTNTNANGDAGASGSGLADVRVKEEPEAHDNGNTRVAGYADANPLTAVNESMHDKNVAHNIQPFPGEIQPFPLAYNYQGRGQQQPQQPQQPVQQQQYHHGFGRAFDPAAYHNYHMQTGQFRQLDADPAGFFGPPMNSFMNTAAHGHTQDGQSDQQTASQHSAPVKEEQYY